MTVPRILHPLGSTSVAAVLTALVAARLPTDDLGGGGRFFMLKDDQGPVAFGGLDGSGPDPMLRSVLVRPEGPGRGHDRAMLQRLAGDTRASGSERLWLLATSVAPFFAGLGWRPTDGASAPETVRLSRRVQGLCPSSAVLMCRMPR
ncbi:MAG TPA: GNAT family N-acetyltransferase [Rubellimicrobium sp.]|nr:GNAT family N-acetyltransferase [Rubellimicrobium sp.]